MDKWLRILNSIDFYHIMQIFASRVNNLKFAGIDGLVKSHGL